MRRHYFIGEFEFYEDSVNIKDKELINQITKVLRLKIGDEIVLGDGKLNEVTVALNDLRAGNVKAKIIKKEKNKNESKTDCILYCAIIKKENFELVAQKVTECGVKEIVPIITERTVKTGLRMDRLVKIVKEAAEQSGRGVLPIVHEPVSFKEALDMSSENDANLIFNRGGESVEKLKIKSDKKIGVVVGPEGWWTEAEIQMDKDSSFNIATLGNLTLRAETAAIVATYLVTNFIG
jgi:16S rRNA (uracil1498-N3)-methyltransferase